MESFHAHHRAEGGPASESSGEAAYEKGGIVADVIEFIYSGKLVTNFRFKSA